MEARGMSFTSQRLERWYSKLMVATRYHSHFSSQYANGVVGTIQINGPASLPYDEDL